MTYIVDPDSERTRIRAALVNSGRFSFFEADSKIANASLTVVVSREAALTPAGQAAILTAVATGIRCFGRVEICGDLDVPLLVPFALGAGSLRLAACSIGAEMASEAGLGKTIFIGPCLTQPPESIQAFWAGWSAGVTADSRPIALGRGDVALAGITAGALAVGQAFLQEQEDPRASLTAQRVSLWAPGGDPSDQGPSLSDCYMPLEFWLVGLGNLGQAYLWSLSFLPFPRPEEVLLFFQDDDVFKRENWGPSILGTRTQFGDMKTRIAEEWAYTRSFRARRIDRRLDAHLRRTEREPAIALVGLDRMAPRKLLGIPGFEYVVDGGLGASAETFQQFRLNIFESGQDPADHFLGVEDTFTIVEDLLKLPAYLDLSKVGGHTPCGVALLAEQSVAVPFVSAILGALAIAQCVRIAGGLSSILSLTGSSGDLSNIRRSSRNGRSISFPVARVSR